ncbi:hypothetical protein V8C40DRAFT_267828 [Trichoderma camerunense]
MAKLAEQDLTPVIRLRGSISASGDLTSLAHIAGALRGKSDISFNRGYSRKYRIKLLIKFLHSLVSYQIINLLAIIDANYAEDVVEMLSMMSATDLYLLCRN